MPIYLDHNATTPLAPEVLEAMRPHLEGSFGNPSSIHRYGRAARNALDAAREQVAALAAVHFSQVIFTGGGTEANNLALRGAAGSMAPGRILVSAIEHSAVLGPAEWLARHGWQLDYLPVDTDGRLRLDALDAELAKGDVRLVSVMAANNETGVLQPVAEAAERVRTAGALLHCDAVQLAGKLAIDFHTLGPQLLTLSAHKLNGPKGIGALVVDRAVDLDPLVIGGGQEAGRRAGTENVPAIVGFGAAAVRAAQDIEARAAELGALRDRLESGLAALPGITVFGRDAERLPNTCQFGVAGMDGETVQMGLDRQGIAVATGSACHSGSGRPSHVLLAMGIEDTVARSAIRVSFGAGNTAADVDALLGALQQLQAHLPSSAVGGF